MPDATSASSADKLAEAPAHTASALLLQGHAQHAQPGDATGPACSGATSLTENSPLPALPMQLDVTIPIPRFRVQDLLALEKDSILESRWPHTDDVPIWCGGARLVWSEFEVADHKLAVRITRLG